MILSADEIRSVSEGILTCSGAPGAHAALQVDLLLEAELRDRPSHGLLRLARIVERIRNKVADPKATGKHTWKGEAFLEVDGQRGLGPVVACTALDAIAEKARSTGISIATIANNNHLGMMAWYAERIASRGTVVIAVSTSEALVHAWGGRRAMLGTNPITIGVPATPRPFVIDMATSLVSMGQIHDYAHRKKALPIGWALDADGNPTTDAEAARDGSIAPFGAAKGYALGLAFEVLVTSLTGSAIGRDVRGTLDASEVCNKGDLFIVIDTSVSGSEAAAIGSYLEAIRQGSPAQGFDHVAIPGDRSIAVRATRLEEGIPVPDDIWNGILALSNKSH